MKDQVELCGISNQKTLTYFAQSSNNSAYPHVFKDTLFYRLWRGEMQNSTTMGLELRIQKLEYKVVSVLPT